MANGFLGLTKITSPIQKRIKLVCGNAPIIIQEDVFFC